MITRGCKFHDTYQQWCEYCFCEWRASMLIGKALDLTTEPKQEEAKKFDTGKPDMSLLTSSMLIPAVKVLMHGSAKYGRLNYRQPSDGFETRLIAAALRHILSYTDGETIDPESGEEHLAHAMASLMLIFDRRAHSK